MEVNPCTLSHLSVVNTGIYLVLVSFSFKNIYLVVGVHELLIHLFGPTKHMNYRNSSHSCLILFRG